MEVTMRKLFRLLAIAALTFVVIAPSAGTAQAQVSTPPGFCTTPPPKNPGWQIADGTGRIDNPPCGESGKYVFTIGTDVKQFNSWTEAENARGNSGVTYYYEGQLESEAKTAEVQQDDGQGDAGQQAVVQGQVPNEEHWARLARLDPVFRSGGELEWLRAAGFTWNESASIDARQVEEEPDPQSGEARITGVQLTVSNLEVRWPMCISTDAPFNKGSDTVAFRAFTNNDSFLITNVTFSGPATAYADCQNDGRFKLPVYGATSTDQTNNEPPVYNPPPANPPPGGNKPPVVVYKSVPLSQNPWFWGVAGLGSCLGLIFLALVIGVIIWVIRWSQHKSVAIATTKS